MPRILFAAPIRHAGSMKRPSQAAADLYTYRLALVQINRLLQSGEPHDRKEADEWLTNSLRI